MLTIKFQERLNKPKIFKWHSLIKALVRGIFVEAGMVSQDMRAFSLGNRKATLGKCKKE